MLNDLWLLVSFLLVIIGLVASQGLLIVVGSLVDHHLAIDQVLEPLCLSGCNP